MKIAILTYNLGMNYGGILQAYAMLETLKRLDHQPKLLYIKSKYKHNWKGLIRKYVLSSFTSRYNNLKYEEEIYQNTFKFIEKYINPKTSPLEKYEDFLDITKKNYDAYIVGSDQVWRAKLYKYIDYAFFDFVKSEKPIFLSYAPSFGVDTWDYTKEETLKYKQQIQRFSGVSVREDSGVELCKKYFEKEAIHVLDPTMLLTASDYRKLIKSENEPKHDGELLNYILDESNEKKELIDMVSKELHTKPFKINAISYNSKNIEDMVYPTVTSWIKGFDDAKYVVTDSFHGCAFAILFNKPFIVYGNAQRGMARFKSLLNMFDLEDRLVYSINEISDSKIQKNIDWDRVNIKLDKYRNISKNYIIEALNCTKDSDLGIN